ALLVAVQLASAALSPRIIGVVFRDPVTKFSLTLLAFTFTFSLSALLRIKSNVPALTAHTAVYANLFCLAVFLYLIDHMGKALRPSGALRSVAKQAHIVIESVYPQRLVNGSSGTDSTAPEQTNGAVAAHHLEGVPTATIASPTDGVVLA